MKSKCCCKLKTIALLELTGSYSIIDNALAKTFKYYWNKKKYPSLPFKPFPIANTGGLIDKNIELLDKYYAKGFRLFVGFSRSQILGGVLSWFNNHPDAIGISTRSISSFLAIKKNIYRINIDTKIGLKQQLLENIKQNPFLSIYCVYIKDDSYSQDVYNYFKNVPIIKERLIGCEFINNPIREELDKYLVNSTKSDFLINGMSNIQLLSLFNEPNSPILPYTYDFYGGILPEMTNIQADNLKGNYTFFLYRGINTSLLWRKGLEDLTNENFSVTGFDTLQVQNYLSMKKSPDLLEGAAGVLQFNPVTKDRKYINLTRYDFTKEKQYILDSIIFDDPLLGNFVSFKILPTP
jgi:hypothetical protein